jgi:hypothetical protein
VTAFDEHATRHDDEAETPMRRVTYAGETFVTTEEVAEALIAFATTLAEQSSAESVQVPILGEDGGPMVIEILVGPSSELINRPEPGPRPALDTTSFVADLLRRGSEARDTPTTARPLEAELPDIDQY